MRSVHPALDSAAVQALSRWRFSPARIGGKPVLVSIVAEMSFTMK
jgi:TonB family protein